MAFDFNFFQRDSQGDAVNVNATWIYTKIDETMATIVAANYFDDVNTGNPYPTLNIDDLIYIVASDSANFVSVTAINPNVTVSAFSINIPAGSITNTDIAANAAIAFSKLAALPSADIVVGSAGNVATAVAMTGDVTISNTGVTLIGAGKVLSAQLDAQTIQYVKVPMTAAQWNGMYATPFVMIAAPGANKLIVVKQAVLAMTFVAAQYDNGGAVSLQWDTTVHGAGPSAQSATIAAATVNGYAASSCLSVEGVVPTGTSSDVVNKGLYLSNASGAFDTGDGTWNIHIWYEIVTL